MSTKITCENGHYIATYAGPVEPGASVVAEQFTEYAEGVGPFQGGQDVHSVRCPTCGGAVFEGAGAGFRVHTDEGLRP